MKSFYDTLGVPPDASADQIKKAYFAMAKKYHPDSGNADDLRRFHEITEAYKALSKKEPKKSVPEPGETATAETTVHTNLYKERITPEREKELRAFHRGVFAKAILRTLALALIFAGLGYIDSLLFDGVWYWGLVAGAGIGGVLGLWRNFDLESWGPHRIVKGLMVIIFTGSLGYFFVILI